MISLRQHSLPKWVMEDYKTLVFYLALVLAIHTKFAFAQANSWIHLRGPYEGNIIRLVCDRQGNVYAAGQFSGVWRSTNSGQNWEQISNGLNWAFLSAFAVDSSGVVYAGSLFSGLFKTTNQGISWTRTSLPGGAVTVQVFRNGRLCVGGADTVSVSTDGGETWSSSIVLTGPASPNVLSVAEDALGNIYATLGVVFIGGKTPYGGGVYVSSDSGRTWKSYGLSLKSIAAIAVGKSNDVFVSNGYTIFSAGIKDSNWVQNATGLPHSRVAALLNSFSGDVVAAIGGGLYVYDENTRAWDVVAGSGLSSTSITSFSYNPVGLSYAGTDRDGIFRMSDPQEGWLQCGISPASVVSLGVDQSGNLYAGTSDGIYKPGPINGTWIRASDGLNSSTVYQIQPSTFRPRVYASTSGGLFYSADSGRSWNGSYYGWTHDLIELSSGNMLAASTGGVVASVDGGVNWSSPNSIALPKANIYALATNEYGTIYAGTGNDGVFRTTDGGNFWTETGLTSPIMFCTVKSLEIDRSGRIFAGTDSSGAYYSDNEGIDWTPITSISGSDVSCFLVNHASKYFAGTLDRGVYISKDGGQDWESINEGLTDSTVTSLVIDPRGYLYAATSNGIFKSINTVTKIAEVTPVAKSYFLSQNYPNPFNPTTVISYQLSVVSHVTLKVYDVLGRRVVVLVDGKKQPGIYTVQFDGRGLPSGAYFYRLEVIPQSTGEASGLQSFVETKKMVLIR